MKQTQSNYSKRTYTNSSYKKNYSKNYNENNQTGKYQSRYQNQGYNKYSKGKQNDTQEKSTYYTNIDKNKISLELEVYNKAKGKQEKVFINGSDKNVGNIINSILNSKYKTLSIKGLSTKEVEMPNGEKIKVVDKIAYGNRNDIKNYNVQLKSVRFKWHTAENLSKEYTTMIKIFPAKKEDGTVALSKNEKQAEVLENYLRTLGEELKNKDSKQLRIGITFIEGENGKRAYIGYIGKLNVPEQEKKAPEKKESGKNVQRNTQNFKRKGKEEVDIPF